MSIQKQQNRQQEQELEGDDKEKEKRELQRQKEEKLTSEIVHTTGLLVQQSTNVYRQQWVKKNQTSNQIETKVYTRRKEGYLFKSGSVVERLRISFDCRINCFQVGIDTSSRYNRMRKNRRCFSSRIQKELEHQNIKLNNKLKKPQSLIKTLNEYLNTDVQQNQENIQDYFTQKFENLELNNQGKQIASHLIIGSLEEI